MNLKDKISDLKQRISITENVLSNHKINYEKLINAKEYSSKDLIRDIESNEGKLANLLAFKGDYEYILGGDGRSQPWSETRKGLIVNVNYNENVYVSNDEQFLIEKYLMAVLDANKINFIYE